MQGALYDRLVAVKIYNPSSRIPAERLHEHVFDELMLVSKLDHENIVNFLGYCLAIEEGKGEESSTIQESRCFMVEEYMPNGSLDRFINGIGIYIDIDVSSEIYRRLHFTVHTHRHQLSLNYVVFRRLVVVY